MIDDARFRRVYDAHGASVLRYCAYSLGSRDAAEDVSAEVFARFLERGEAVPDDRVEAWLVRVARNLCASRHRARTRELRLTSRLAATPPEADAWSDPDCWFGLRTLKEHERLAVYLRIVEDLPFSDVARLMGKGEGAVKMTFYRAVEKLRHQYTPSQHASAAALAGGACDE